MFGKLSSPKVVPEAVFDEMRRRVVKIVRYIALEFTIRTTQLKVGVQVVLVGIRDKLLHDHHHYSKN